MTGTDSSTPRLSPAKRTAGFAGAVILMLHAVGIGLWAALNMGLVPQVLAFDPYPFHLLTLVVSAEAVLLCIAVLIRLDRMEARAEERNRLALRVGLMVEEEVVEAAQMLERIEARLGSGNGITNPRAKGGRDDRGSERRH
jgi:uncharacterized membrane protein